jgi:hypothetical protein
MRRMRMKRKMKRRRNRRRRRNPLNGQKDGSQSRVLPRTSS